MDWKILVPGIVGAACGALGWLCVGLFMSHRQNERQARNAGRAVYFELAMNRMSVDVAREYAMFPDLGRSSFDRLLPELATWLAPAVLQTSVTAYMSHVGYEQARTDADVPAEVRREALSGILSAQDRAIDALRGRVFSAEEARAIEGAPETAP
jgi:hypothetical protein